MRPMLNVNEKSVDVSSNMELGQAHAASSAALALHNLPTFGQVAANQVEMKKIKYKIIAATILGLGSIIGAIILTYLGLFYWKMGPDTQKFFEIVLIDKTQSSKIHLDFHVDPNEALEYVRSPEEMADGRTGQIIGLRDFKKGIEAYKELDGEKCFIGMIEPETGLQTYTNGSVQEGEVENNETFVLLNQTIHPFVLRLAAGDKIVEFCGDSAAIWMIPYDEAFDTPEQTEQSVHSTRTKRWGCWKCGGYRRGGCWWGCSWWGWKKVCSKRCYY